MFGPDGPTFLELARQALSSTERGYDLLAPKFDHTPFRTPDAIVEAAAALAGEVQDAIDLCCGTGAGLIALRPYCRRRLIGVDISQGMLDVAQERLAAHPGPASLTLQRLDVRALPYREELDLATCFGALGHITAEDEAPFLDSIRRALRPGGRFVFATAEQPPPLSPPALLSRAFNAAMHLRNALIKPAFVMYYLTFTLPRVSFTLRRHGFEVEVIDPALDAPMSGVRLVVATRP